MQYERWSYTYEDYKREFTEAALINNDENVTLHTRKSWLPRKCYLSGKKLWMQEAVKLVRLVHLQPNKMAGSRPIKETYWLDSREYMLAVLRYKR